MTPKMKEDICAQILVASRQLFLSSRISEICLEKGTQKQLEFVLELMNEELTLRDENRRKRLIKRAGFPIYKTFEDYSYRSVKFPPAFCREELEALEFVPEKKNLVLYGPVGIGKTHMAIQVYRRPTPPAFRLAARLQSVILWISNLRPSSHVIHIGLSCPSGVNSAATFTYIFAFDISSP